MGAEQQGYTQQVPLFPQAELDLVDLEDWVVYRRGWQVKTPESTALREIPEALQPSRSQWEPFPLPFPEEDLRRLEAADPYLKLLKVYARGTGLDGYSLEQRSNWFDAHRAELDELQDAAIVAGNRYEDLRDAYSHFAPVVERRKTQ